MPSEQQKGSSGQLKEKTLIVGEFVITRNGIQNSNSSSLICLHVPHLVFGASGDLAKKMVSHIQSPPLTITTSNDSDQRPRIRPFLPYSVSLKMATFHQRPRSSDTLAQRSNQTNILRRSPVVSTSRMIPKLYVLVILLNSCSYLRILVICLPLGKQDRRIQEDEQLCLGSL